MSAGRGHDCRRRAVAGLSAPAHPGNSDDGDDAAAGAAQSFDEFGQFEPALFEFVGLILERTELRRQYLQSCVIALVVLGHAYVERVHFCAELAEPALDPRGFLLRSTTIGARKPRAVRRACTVRRRWLWLTSTGK